MTQGSLVAQKLRSRKSPKNSNHTIIWMTSSCSSLDTWKGLTEFKRCVLRLVHLSPLLRLETPKNLEISSISGWDTRNAYNGVFNVSTREWSCYSNFSLRLDYSLPLLQVNLSLMLHILYKIHKWAGSKQFRHPYQCIAVEDRVSHQHHHERILILHSKGVYKVYSLIR
jgi:hypothetical protein